MWLSFADHRRQLTPLLLHQRFLSHGSVYSAHIYVRENLKLSAKTGDVLVQTRSVRPASIPGRLVLRHFHYLLYHRDLQARRRRNLPIHKVSLFEELTQSSLSFALNLIRSRGKRFMRKRLSFGFFRDHKLQLCVACTSVYFRRLAQINSFTSLSIEDFYFKKRQLNVWYCTKHRHTTHVVSYNPKSGLKICTSLYSFSFLSSDTGVSPPESCIFGLMTFISACAGIWNSSVNICSVISVNWLFLGNSGLSLRRKHAFQRCFSHFPFIKKMKV